MLNHRFLTGKSFSFFQFALALVLTAGLSACGGSNGSFNSGAGSSASSSSGSSPGGTTGGGGGGSAPASRTVTISPGPDATLNALNAFVDARPGDVIQFECGFFDLTQTMLLSNTEAITIQGCSDNKDDTVLSFRNSSGVEGILMDSVRGVTIQNLVVADSDGNGFELRSVDHATLRNVHAYWSSGGGRFSPDPLTADNYQDGRLHIPCTDPPFLNPEVPENQGNPDSTSPDYTPSDGAGRYGIYPVKSINILIENSESTGASDAGIYVGQSSNSIIRNNRAVYNVFGFEIENVQGGEYSGNLAECNTGGFLVYDLDNLTQYGSKTRVFNNISRNNNTYNFTEGGIVSQIPPGTGMLTLSYDRIDVFDNQFLDNNTGGFIHVSYELLPEGGGRPEENRIDWYSEGVHIFNNEFRNNGNRLPAATTEDLSEGNTAKVLPALIGLKTQAACNNPTNTATCAGAADTDNSPETNGGFRGGHIVWDGLLPELDADCPYPKDKNGNNVPADEHGKPQHTNEDPNPECHYNAYKFHSNGDRIVPLWFASCIDNNNLYSADSLTYIKFNGTKGANAAIKASSCDPTDLVCLGSVLTPEELQEFQEFPSEFDMSPHNCPVAYGSNLPLLPPVVIPPFEPSEDFDPAPTEEEVETLCEADQTAGVVNFNASNQVDCPLLSHYNLFADADDPRSAPNSNGVPFVLNSKLFSDYTTKYRVTFLPTGERITYNEPGDRNPNATLTYPVGTIIAKTFAFPIENGTAENVVETRLIIKRRRSNGQVRWDPLVYVWQDDGNGGREAVLQPAGATVAAQWNYTDPETGTFYSGSTDSYSVPNKNQCLSCHTNEDVDSGSAPIGPKVRNMNRPYRSESPVVTAQSQHESSGQNQLVYLCNSGRMVGCPSDLSVDTNGNATAMERIPKFNIPGDSGFTANSDEDIEARARAWIEVNCAHCHNVRGFAANTGFYVDVFRRVDTTYGICKGPTATGAEGSGGRAVDIHPGRADLSILEYRISDAAQTPSARMPPIARSVVDEQGHDLIQQWINQVIVADDDQYPGSESCTND